MEHLMKKAGKASSFLTKHIGIIIICFSVIAFFWHDGFAWTTKYTSTFLGVAMFGMGLTIKIEDFKRVFSRPKEIVIGFVAQYTIMPVVAWGLCRLMQLPTDLALGVILVGCCPGGTASNVITYIAGGDVALSVGMTITSTLAAPLMTPLLVYLLSGASDFCCVDRHDHQRNRLCQFREDHKLWSARAWSCGTSQSLRDGDRTWRRKTFTYRI